MFKSALLFILLTGCESSTFEVENSIDTNESIANNVVFNDCGYVVGSHTCNFALLDDEGNEVNLYDFYGKTIVLRLGVIIVNKLHMKYQIQWSCLKKMRSFILI